MFTDCYCTQFRRASNALTQIYDAALKPAGLRITQFSLLRSLARLGQATSTQVGVELSLDRTTISRNVKLLIDAGWVGVVEADDKRERVLAITKAGQKKIADALPYFKKEKAQKTVEQGAETFVETSKDNRLLEALENLQRAGAESAAVR